MCGLSIFSSSVLNQTLYTGQGARPERFALVSFPAAGSCQSRDLEEEQLDSLRQGHVGNSVESNWQVISKAMGYVFVCELE